MSRIFISHSSRNDDVAIAIKDWLGLEGWSAEDDVFLDLDPERGIVAGERWRIAFERAVTRCEAVLFLVSEDWLKSKWCNDEYHLAAIHNKPLFALLIDDVSRDRLPGGLAAQWQCVSLKGEPARRFVTVHPKKQTQSPVHIAEAALVSIKRGLEKAGIGPTTFELAADPASPTGWRAPYRGLEALEAKDAAVFFGRDHDIVRGLDVLRGLAGGPPPRLLVILGASGAGKSSFLRAGLWPRLARDDARWLPLAPIRAGRGGAIEGGEGLLAAMEDVHRRFGLKCNRAGLREQLATPDAFLALLADVRRKAAERALRTEPRHPMPVICLDQAEELFAPDAGVDAARLVALARAAMESNAALVLATIRSDTYNTIQSAPALAGIHPHTLSLGPVPAGEMASIIRKPAELLRRKVGPASPIFDEAVVERLLAEIAGEADALPLLAFVLERLIREHADTPVIGVAELERTGGVTDAIRAAADSALDEVGVGTSPEERRGVLRELFVPRLARVNVQSKAVQRRTAPLSSVPQNLMALAKALVARRLLVTSLSEATSAAGDESPAGATVEVAHEALLRRWTTLEALLAEDRDALYLLDATRLAAEDWGKAKAKRKGDFLAHRGSRLADARKLQSRGPEWAALVAPARDYLEACDAKEREEQRRTERANRWIRAGLVAASLFAVVAGGAAWWAWQQQQVAEATTREAQITQSGLLAQAAREISERPFGGVPPLAMLLALEGIRDEASDDTRMAARAWVPEARFELDRAYRQMRETGVFAHDEQVPSISCLLAELSGWLGGRMAA